MSATRLATAGRVAPGDAEWQTRAACAEAEPELFFEPDGQTGRRATARRVKAALAYCAECPVVRECLATTVAAEYGRRPFGVAGGMTASQRLAERRAARAQRDETGGRPCLTN